MPAGGMDGNIGGIMGNPPGAPAPAWFIPGNGGGQENPGCPPECIPRPRPPRVDVEVREPGRDVDRRDVDKLDTLPRSMLSASEVPLTNDGSSPIGRSSDMSCSSSLP